MRVRPSQSLALPARPAPYPMPWFPPPAIPSPAARRFELIALFGVLTVFTPIAIDLYLPALPTIARRIPCLHRRDRTFAGRPISWAWRWARRWSVRCRTVSAARWPILVGLGLYVLGSAGLRPGAGPHHPGHRPLCRGRGRLRRHGAGARLCARSVSARAGGAHLRPDAADPVGVAAVRALCSAAGCCWSPAGAACSGCRAARRC